MEHRLKSITEVVFDKSTFLVTVKLRILLADTHNSYINIKRIVTNYM